jgi:ABC-type antimicrobial peptide transport system permease subunit
MRTIALGLAAGTAIALSVGFLLKAVLLGAAFDPVALVVAPCLLSATAAAAIAWPTFRATSVDPMTLLREE